MSHLHETVSEQHPQAGQRAGIGHLDRRLRQPEDLADRAHAVVFPVPQHHDRLAALRQGRQRVQQHHAQIPVTVATPIGAVGNGRQADLVAGAPSAHEAYSFTKVV